jgi:DNA-binding response OmpR family regulator
MSTTQDHILVVDDDPEIRRLLQTYLERNGLHVTAVGDGGGMWMALDRSRVDLIVLDLMAAGFSSSGGFPRACSINRPGCYRPLRYSW